jgi:hypothetical protein
MTRPYLLFSTLQLVDDPLHVTEPGRRRPWRAAPDRVLWMGLSLSRLSSTAGPVRSAAAMPDAREIELTVPPFTGAD